ncbi:lipopolysaccharide transport periplasmic protein LptA [Oceanisphaera avium]|uniref:Lipopolysaccharide export system protein LptA n=1 Tax=Oceanisphaera avium TaxID=1903694 RepID=A0A1Y0CZQ0_9GAMM|nr:lipopolysaccharide transport periplasmic protein LptA [Oceanisphaera avium]ART80812.1 lipopolysaccharide transport periplasmic protein LptA [Oceanisphaera avium]
MILRQPTRLLSFAALLVLSMSTTQAKEADYKEPVTIDAGSQLVELANNKVTFTDNVIVKQGTLDVRAAKLVVTRNDKGLQTMTAYGSPATYYQVLDSGQPVNAQAKQITYDIKTRSITLLNNAQLKQNDNIVTGYRIRYDIDREQMEAQGQGNQGRVKTVFLPEQLQEMNNKEANP